MVDAVVLHCQVLMLRRFLFLLRFILFQYLLVHFVIIAFFNPVLAIFTLTVTFRCLLCARQFLIHS